VVAQSSPAQHPRRSRRACLCESAVPDSIGQVLLPIFHGKRRKVVAHGRHFPANQHQNEEKWWPYGRGGNFVQRRGKAGALSCRCVRWSAPPLSETGNDSLCGIYAYRQDSNTLFTHGPDRSPAATVVIVPIHNARTK